MKDAQPNARQKRVRQEGQKAPEEAALSERTEYPPLLSEDDFLAYVRDELVPAARNYGYEVTLTKLSAVIGPVMYYDPDTLEGVTYAPGEDVPKRMLDGEQWREEAQRRNRSD